MFPAASRPSAFPQSARIRGCTSSAQLAIPGKLAFFQLALELSAHAKSAAEARTQSTIATGPYRPDHRPYRPDSPDRPGHLDHTDPGPTQPYDPSIPIRRYRHNSLRSHRLQFSKHYPLRHSLIHSHHMSQPSQSIVHNHRSNGLLTSEFPQVEVRKVRQPRSAKHHRREITPVWGEEGGKILLRGTPSISRRLEK